MKVLVTGAHGFVGSWLVPELERGGHEVIALGDAFDVREPTWPTFKLADQTGLDAVVHLAALVGRLNCENVHDPADVIATNAAGTLNVARACADAGVRMIYVSTSEAVWNGNLYGMSKRWGEEAARHTMPASDLDVLRLYMAYGPGHPPGIGRAAITNYLWNALHGWPLVVHEGAARPWCWIGDIVTGIRLIVESDRDRKPEVWDVGSTAMRTMLEVAQTAIELVGSRSAIHEVPLPDTGVLAVKCPRPSYLRGLGWRETIDLTDGMKRTLEWLRTLPSDGIGSPTALAGAGTMHGRGGGK